jgi:hypothetical protein
MFDSLRLQQICRFSSALDAISGGRFSGDLFVSSGGTSLCSIVTGGMQQGWGGMIVLESWVFSCDVVEGRDVFLLTYSIKNPAPTDCCLYVFSVC